MWGPQVNLDGETDAGDIRQGVREAGPGHLLGTRPLGDMAGAHKGAQSNAQGPRGSHPLHRLRKAHAACSCAGRARGAPRDSMPGRTARRGRTWVDTFPSVLLLLNASSRSSGPCTTLFVKRTWIVFKSHPGMCRACSWATRKAGSCQACRMVRALVVLGCCYSASPSLLAASNVFVHRAIRPQKKINIH